MPDEEVFYFLLERGYVYSTPTENDEKVRHVSCYIHRVKSACEGISERYTRFCSMPHILEMMSQRQEKDFTKNLPNGKTETMQEKNLEYD
jgi:hypothetical protein